MKADGILQKVIANLKTIPISLSFLLVPQLVDILHQAATLFLSQLIKILSRCRAN